MNLKLAFRVARESRELRDLMPLSLVLGIAYSFVVPFMSLFGTKEAGMTPSEFGVFMTVTSLSGIALSSYLAKRSDLTWPRKSVLILGSLSGAVGYFSYAWVRDPYWLTLFGSIFLGVASVTFSQVFAYARDLLERRQASREEVPLIINIVRLTFAFAWTFGPALAAWVMSVAGFPATMVTAAAFYLIFCTLVALRAQHLPPEGRSKAERDTLTLAQVFRVRGLLPFFIAFCLIAFSSTMGMMNLPLLITRTLGQSEVEVGIVYSVAPVFEIPFMFFLGILAGRIAAVRLIAGALFVSTVYYLALSLVAWHVHVYFLQVLSAAVVAVTSGVAITFFQDFLPAFPGTATNLYANSARVGATAGYLAFGQVAERYGHSSVFSVCAFATSLALLLVLLARRPSENAAARAA